MMGRILALTALTALLVWAAAPAQAGPVAAVIGAISTAVSTIGATFLGSIFLNILKSAALSALARALGPKSRGQSAGIRTSSTMTGGVTAQRFIVGRYATAGILVAPPMSFALPGGPPNEYLCYAIALSVVPGCTLQRLIVDSGFVERSEVREEGGFNTTGDSAGFVWVDYLDGTQAEAHQMLRARFGADPDRPWLADMIGPGTCYSVLRFRYSRERFNGLPQCRFELLGIPLYDPRQDSTVGGSGPQRWADASTWTQTENNAVIIYNIMRGIRVGAGRIWGGESEAEDLPLASWFAAMNECDVLVDTGAGGLVPKYRCGIEIALDDEPAAVIEELLKACHGEMVEVGGIWTIRVGPPALPVHFVTDEDILVSEEQESDPFPGLSDTWNGIAATYPEPASLWEPKEAPPRYNPVWEAEDHGRRLVADLDLPACAYGEQVQRLMQAYIADHRRRRRHQLSLPPEAATLMPLDTIGWTSARHGYTGKVFEVTGQVDHLMTLNQAMSLRERDDSDFVWLPTDLLASDVMAPGTTPPALLEVLGFDVSAEALLDGSGMARRLQLTMVWHPGLAAVARGIQWQIRVTGTAAISMTGSHGQLADGFTVVSGGLIPTTSYEVRACLISDRASVWTNWVTVLTPDLRISSEDLSVAVQEALAEATVVREAAYARAAEVLAEANAAVAALRAAAEGAFGDLLGEISPPLVPRLSALDTAMDSRIADIARIDVDRALQVPREIETGLAIDTLSERLGSLTLQLSRLRSDVTDAGIYIDPDLGRARIEAVSRIDGTISEVVVLVDALRNEISLRATYSEVYEVVTAAQLDPTTLPIITSLVARLSEAELVVSGLQGSIIAKADTIELDGVSARVTEAEADINSLEEQIALRVETTTFDDLEERVGAAEVTLGTIDAPSISLAVRDARAAALAEDELATLTLQQMMQTIRDRQVAQADVASARQDLTALVTEDREAIATLRTDLGAAVAGSSALVTAEREARATEAGALASAIDDVAVSVSGLSGAITEINRIEADSASAAARALRQLQLDLGLVSGDIAAQAGAVTALTGRVELAEGGLEAEVRDTSVMRVALGEAEDEQASGDLRALLADIDGRSALSRGLADLRTDAWVLLEEGRQAVAGVRAEITVALGSATALIDAERVARTAADQAEAADRLALRADLTATAAALVTEQQVRAGADEALAEQATDLAARLAAAESGVEANATASEVLTTRVTDVEGAISSQSDQLTTLNSSLGTTNTNVAAVQAAAQAAADLAGGKGKVIVQSAAPAVADRLTQNLWIDTSGAANTPKRWSGTAWVAVTDKVATDAAAAAATALEQVANKADATAVTALTMRVTEAEGEIIAQGQSLATLGATVSHPETGLDATRAAVGTLENAIASPTMGLAARTATLETAVNDPATGLAATQAKATTAEEAITNPSTGLAARTTTLETAVNHPTTGLAAVRAKATTAEEAITTPTTGLAARTASLETAVNDPATGLDAVRAKANTVEQALTAPTTGVAARTATLETAVNDPATGLAATRAKAETVEQAITAPTTGVAARTATLETAVNDPATGLDATRAKANTVETAINTPTTGIAARTASLEAVVNNPTTGLAATRSEISAEAVTRSSQFEALAGQIDTVSASVGGLSAETSAQATAIATIEGRQVASQVFRARAGGAVGEIELVAADNPGGDAISEAIVRADRLKFLGNFAQFFSDVTINGDLIVTGSITTPRIGGNAISAFRSGTGFGSDSIGTTVIVALTFVPDPAGVQLVMFSGYAGPTGANLSGRLRIRWRGVLLAEYGPPSNTVSPVTFILAVPSGDGIGTLSVEVVGSPGGGGLTASGHLVAAEFKR